MAPPILQAYGQAIRLEQPGGSFGGRGRLPALNQDKGQFDRGSLIRLIGGPNGGEMGATAAGFLQPETLLIDGGDLCCPRANHHHRADGR